jgi:redox-sensitive bicupin YhaK (pirin superfamily)
MSRFDCEDPVPGDARSCDAVEHIIVPRARDIGDFEVRRALPSAKRQMVGPFIFFDQMGPARMEQGHGIDVRPHPHIGLSTVTWLFEGQIFHRDSLGSSLPINPGAVNWMRAGKGIVHSERTGDDERASRNRCSAFSHGLPCPRTRKRTLPASGIMGQTNCRSFPMAG